MNELLESPSKLKNYLIHRLNSLLGEIYHTQSTHDSVRIRGNCNEIELMLMHLFGMRLQEIELIEKKVNREHEYYRLKYGGYCLTADSSGKSIWMKDGKIVDPNFTHVDNGVGDMKAVVAAYDFQQWLQITGITKIDWMLEAEIIPPSLIEVKNYSFEGYTLLEGSREEEAD